MGEWHLNKVERLARIGLTGRNGICRGSAPVPTPYASGQPQEDCPYDNYIGK
jgi:hypothetical protein